MEDFKVGDWVRYDEIISKVIGFGETFDNSMPWMETSSEDVIYYNEEIVKLWIPEEGEWCWFWDNACAYPDLRKFSNIHRFKDSIINYYATADSDYYEFCEPFIGEIPDFVKGK